MIDDSEIVPRYPNGADRPLTDAELVFLILCATAARKILTTEQAVIFTAGAAFTLTYGRRLVRRIENTLNRSQRRELLDNVRDNGGTVVNWPVPPQNPAENE